MLRNLKQFSLPEIEEKVLKFWKENQIFEKSLKLREKGKKFRFFEGPPTANGRPGIHHLESRAFKDVICRFKTMRGYFVRRKAGWDTQGLPVEIEVEKELGLKNKQDIEKFGIAEFNEKAKLSVWKYQDEWEKLTDRIGFWLNLKEAYITYKPQYIESLWWIFKKIADRGLLKQSFKIIPFCPRCQTPLSSHEMGQPGVYKKVKDPSVFIKFKVKSDKKQKENEYLLVWTTTPWTLPSNVAIAVNPNLSYTKYKIGDEFIWSYNIPPFDSADGKAPEVIEKISGKKLAGVKYKPLFSVKGPWLKNKKFFQVYEADFVGTEDGTGLVHIAPAFGEDDMNMVKKFQKDLVGEIPITIDEKGIVQSGLPGAGKFAKLADKDIIEYLVKEGSMPKHGEIEHEYPFCWRCSTPILYYARFSWFVEMSSLSNELLKNNEKINWVPEYVKEGRFGNWLREVKDWAISRNRYWGTPLPIWQCQIGKSEIRNSKSETILKSKNANSKQKGGCGHIEVIGSLADLDKAGFPQNKFFLMRHGEGDHMVKSVIASGPEKGSHIAHLTEKGKREVEAEAKAFIRRLGKEKLDYIYSSPYARTRQTAEIVAKLTKAKIITDGRLSEINAGSYNWRSPEEFHKFFGNDLEIFTKAPPGGENHNEVKKRMMEAVLEINSKHKNKNILMVSHGNPLWMLEGVLRGLSNKEILKMDYKYSDVNGGVREAEVHNWPYNSDGEIDLHRPYIDAIYLKCPKCGEKMERVKEVADCWFDSGAMPFAQDHFPFACLQKELPITNYQLSNLQKCIDFPADYISEGIDQTRGWFYTLLAISTALGFDIPPFLNVITLGLVLDKNGQKMSKSKGNVVSPWDMVQKYGSDVVRWYFYTINPPGEPKKFDELDLGKMLRKFIMMMYNSFVFFDTYAEKNYQLPHAYRQAGITNYQSANVLDKWVLIRLNQTIIFATENLEKYDVGLAGKSIEAFVDDLSRWYIRRSRARLQKSNNKEDFNIASQTLHYCLLQLSGLIAPFTPFFAEALFQSLTAGRRPSIHLEDWPSAGGKNIDLEFLGKMEEARRLASLALALRTEKGIKVRQPLNKLEIKTSKLDVRDNELLEILKDEVNVKSVEFNLGMKEEINLDLIISPELKEEGILREFIRMVQGLRHDANYIPKDEILLMIEAPEIIIGILERESANFKKEVGAKNIEFSAGGGSSFGGKKFDKFDVEIDSKIDDERIWIGVRKI